MSNSGTKAKCVNDVINLRIPKIEAEPQSHVSRKMKWVFLSIEKNVKTIYILFDSESISCSKNVVANYKDGYRRSISPEKKKQKKKHGGSWMLESVRWPDITYCNVWKLFTYSSRADFYSYRNNWHSEEITK